MLLVFRQCQKTVSDAKNWLYSRYIKVAYTCVIVLMSIRLIWSNYNQPIIDFSDVVANSIDTQDIDIFAPFNFLVSFPAVSRTNCLGVPMWFFILNRVLDIVCNKWTMQKVPARIVDEIPVQ